MNNLVDYAVVAGAGALVTALLLRPARLISVQLGYQAMPDERKVHESPTPYGGGAAMMIGLCVAMLVAFAIPTLHNVMISSNEMMGVLLAAGVIFTVGAVDDFRPMSAPAKVAGQFLGLHDVSIEVTLRGIRGARSINLANYYCRVGLCVSERHQLD